MTTSARSNPRTRISTALVLGATLLSTAACDLGTDPPPSQLGAFNPFTFQLGIEETLVPVQASAEGNRLLILALTDLVEDGLVLYPDPSAAPLDRAAALAAATGGPVILPRYIDIPPAMLGKVIVYNLSSGRFEPDPNLTGAPATGMRVRYYAVNQAGDDVALPLIERGYIDVIDEDAGDLSRVRTILVNTVTGVSATLMNIVQGYRETVTATDSVFFLEGQGFFTDGLTQINFSMTANSTEAIGSDDETYSHTLAFSGPSGGFQFSWDGMFDPATQGFEDDFDITFDSSGGTIVLTMTTTNQESPFEGTGSGMLTASGTTVADIDLQPGGNLAFDNPNGAAFSSNDRSRLNSLVVVMWVGGYSIFRSLPLLIFL